MSTDNQYDVIIVGGSYSGLSAGMALGRALRKVLIIDSGNPCNQQTPHSHNFLTNDGKTPNEIAAIARAQVSAYETVSFLNAFVVAGHRIENGFEIRTDSGETYVSRKLVFATGIKDIMPDIPGFSSCWGISVIHCPYCHGYEVRNQKTGILANGDAAFEFASLISNWTADLTIYTNGKSTLTEQQLHQLQKHAINIVEQEIEFLEHNSGHIHKIGFKNKGTASVKALYARLPFIQHSSLPNSLGCELTPEGYLKIDAANKTTLHGVYACGDNAYRMRTVANAVSMGTITGIMINKELIDEKWNN